MFNYCLHVQSCLKESKEAIYKIFASHGNIVDLVYFAEAMRDYPQIIVHYLQEENYVKALEALGKAAQQVGIKSRVHLTLSC